ncbi:MAG: G8 domain-containing protein, partial [Pseudomonadota bacterium]
MDTNTTHSTEMGMGHTMPGPMAPMPSMELVDLAEVTHTAVQSGDWSNPDTWADGRIPDDAARVHVPSGLSVTVDGEVTSDLKTVRVDGTLTFATDIDTELRVDTLVTTQGSQLIIGSETAPIQADVTAKIVFADDGPIDQSWDPTLVSRGALLHGQTTIFGAEKLAFTALETPAVAGDLQITLSTDPTGWRVGDEITIAGTDPGDPTGDEVVTITEISGRTITFNQPLQSDHVPPRADLDVHVANLTRNIEFSSENSDPGHAGHVMFMHTNDADIRHFSMEGLGRTDKAAGVDDWQLVSESEGSVGPDLTEVIDLGGDNVRGRYSLHFHRGGDEGPAARVEGAVVRDDPGWAYVNHSSNVDFIGNVSHNVVGAAFNTEAGDEVGSFIGNIAIRTYNPDGKPNPPDFEVNEDQSPDIRVLTQDFGWQGDGFWFHGPGVTVDNNVVSGASGHAYIYWPLGLVEEGLGEALGSVDDLSFDVRPKQIPVPSFDGNIAYGAPKALTIAYLHTDNRDDNDEFHESEGLLGEVPQSYEEQLQSTFSNFTAWNIDLNAIAAPYSGRLTFENIDIIGTGEQGSVGLKLDQFDNENDITVRDVTIDGFDIGLAAPRQGEGLIDGAQIVAGVSDIRISMPDGAPRDLDLRNIEYLSESLIYTDLSERVNVSMEAAHDLGLAGGLFGDEEGFFDEPNLLNVPPIFLPDRITYETPEGEVVGLYFDLQAPDFVPVVRGGELSQFVPDDIVGLTNAELYQQFGFSAGGAVAAGVSTPEYLAGGYAGTPLPETYPPSPTAYWTEFLAEFGVDIPWAPSEGGAGPMPGDPPSSGSGAGGDDAPDDEAPGAGAGDDGGASDDAESPNDDVSDEGDIDEAGKNDRDELDRLADEARDEDEFSDPDEDDPYDEPEPDTDIFEENDREDLDRLAEDERDEDDFAVGEEGDPDGGEDRFAEEDDREELDRLAELERDEDDFTFADEDEFSADEDPLADTVED